MALSCHLDSLFVFSFPLFSPLKDEFLLLMS
jgi:hypothetical protein